MPDGVPNYLTTNADGSVTAEFSGGVIMPLQPDPGVLPDYQAGGSIAWTDGPGGAKLAYNVGIKNAGTGEIGNHLVARDGTNTPTNRLARISAFANPSTGLARVEAYAKNPAGVAASTTLVIDSDEQSDFVQLGSGNAKRMLRDTTLVTAAFNVPAGTAFGPVFFPWSTWGIASGNPSYVRVIGTAIRDFGNASAVTVSFTFPGGGLNIFGKNNGGAACGFQLDVTLLTDL